MNLEYVLPEDIERRSFEIIESELHGREFPEKIKPVMYRVIHTTADFDYADNLCFSENAVAAALALLSLGLAKGTQVELTAQGEDEKIAVDELVALIESGFGEL